MDEEDDVFLEIKETQEETRASIQRIGEQNHLGPEEWIQQAKRLQADIEKSRATARGIVKQAQHADALRAQRSDTAGKADLLRAEVAFNVRLQSVLEQFRRLQLELGSAQEVVRDGDLLRGFESLKKLEDGLRNLRAIDTTTAAQLLYERVEKLRTSIEDESQRLFNEFLEVNRDRVRLTIHDNVRNSNSSLDLQAWTGLSKDLNTLDANAFAFSAHVETAILEPLLSSRDKVGSSNPRLAVSGAEIYLDHDEVEMTADGALRDTMTLLSFIKHTLPPSLCENIAEHLVPSLVHRLLSNYLPSTIDSDIHATSSFESMVQQTTAFAARLTEEGWGGASDVQEWVEAAPRVWISKRREASLATVKQILRDHLHSTRTAERVETQMISRKELIGGANGSSGVDDWDEDWGEDEPAAHKDFRTPLDETSGEEDASAWDMEDEPPTSMRNTNPLNGSSMPERSAAYNDREEDTDAWDWNEDDDAPSSGVSARKPSKAMVQTPRAAKHYKEQAQEQELTLRETYTVSRVPEALATLVTTTCNDAEALQLPPLNTSSVAPAASALRSVPTLILAGYRALAATYYQPLEGSNMFLYNDAMYLSETLASFQDTHQPQRSSLVAIDLGPDTAALESFARRAYGKEMDSQRTIIRDLLGLAQGFSNCTEQPHRGACDDAVSAVVDHITGLQRQWSKILSQSALLQSLGSLLQSVIAKMIVDIEDLPDIGEDESARLRHYCDEVSKLSKFFVQVNPSDTQDQQHQQQQQSDTTPLYVPNWFKFQHLAEILESKLADIRYFWGEGDLKLDFEREELVELIQALFAESDLRRKAIREVRRG
ncbi:MAG: hypothetical protein M1828_005485 [Chrysothrix sp. TS-e1954]|nr:MAG: hypothetical protein M1828_005485 [Chrysothrix sp. TS-e1954]